MSHDSSLPSDAPLVDDAVVQRVVAAGLERGADFAELFVEEKRSSSALLDDGRVEELTSGRDRGAGVRVVVGDSTGFAHTSDLSEQGLLAAARTAAAAAARGPARRWSRSTGSTRRDRTP